MNILTFDQIYREEYQERQNKTFLNGTAFQCNVLKSSRYSAALNINQMQPVHGVDMSKTIVKLKKDQIQHKVGKRFWNACMMQFFPQM